MAGDNKDDPKTTRNVGADKNNQEDDEPLVVVPATPLFQTTFRQKVTPYLPPPVVIAMKKIDPQLEPYIGPEPSINIMCTFWLALFLWQLMKLLSKVAGVGGGGQAIQDDPHDSMADGGNVAAALLRNNTRYYDETLLLCGPSLGGKTSLFYTLLGSSGMKLKTVKSLQPNSDYLTKDQKTMMILDLPGLWDASKVMTTIQETIKTNKSKPMHIVVVLDSTQSVSKVADYLYKLLLLSTTSTNNDIIIACHKSKAPKAKNVRRIKIQIRTELERLSKLQDQDTDWESILNDKTKLIPTSCDPPAWEELWKELEA